MILIEPPSVWNARDIAIPPWAAQTSALELKILQVLASKPFPIPFFTVVNHLAREKECGSRSEREAFKKEIVHTLCRLLGRGILQRKNRTFVALAEPILTIHKKEW
jgi:hypothetical protein